MIGTIRREYVDHLIVLSEAHLRRKLANFPPITIKFGYHRGLRQDAPLYRPIERSGAIRLRPILGGLHHAYFRG